MAAPEAGTSTARPAITSRRAAIGAPEDDSMKVLKIPVIGLALLLGACAGTPKAPSCNESAYSSLNPAHYDPVKERTRSDAPFLFPTF